MSDESLKIEDLRIGMLVDCVEYQWSLHPAMTGARICKIDGIEQTVTLGSHVVHVGHLRRHVPVEESPKEEPAPKREWKAGIPIRTLWVHKSELCEPGPKEESPKEAPLMMPFNYPVPVEEPAPATDPIKAVADRTVLTFRDRLIIAIASGVSTTDAVTFTDRIIVEMAKVKS